MTLFSRSLLARLTAMSMVGNAFALALAVCALTSLQLYQGTKSELGSWDHLGYAPAHDLVIKSLVRSENGRVEIKPTPELIELMKGMPNLKFAVFDPGTSEALPGSSGDESLRPPVKIGAVLLSASYYEDARHSTPRLPGVIQAEDTSLGRYIISIFGYSFRWQDIFRDMFSDFLRAFPQVMPFFGVVMIISIWLTLRHGLKPLKKLAGQAQGIDLNSLHQRLPEKEAPIEIEPFVSAVNCALAKLDAGVERERRFSANVAHELRTPITILIALVETMSKDAKAIEVKRQLNKLKSIVEQLLISARIERSASHAEQCLDLAATVFSKVLDYSPLVVENGRDIVFEGPSSGVMAKGDPTAIECIVGNLLDNALRAEPAGGSVIVSVTPEGAFSVIDHGEGVAAGEQQKIFEPFWRKNENLAGTGLGLAITKDLSDKIGAHISVEETPGGGATFRLALLKAERAADADRTTLSGRRGGVGAVAPQLDAGTK